MAIINAPNQGFNLLIETLLNKEKLGQEKERINLQRKDFELRQEQAQVEQQRQQDMLEGARAAANILLMQRPDIMQAAPSSPGALPSFLQNLQGFQLGQEQVNQAKLGTAGLASDVRVKTGTEPARVAEIQAGSRKAVSEANVAEATEGTRIEQARATLADTNIRNAINSQVLAGSDPVNGARALSQWASTGLPWGQVKEAVGFTGKTSIPDDAVFTPAESSAGGQDRAKAQMFLPGMRQSQEIITNLGRGLFDADGDGKFETRLRGPVRMTVLGSLQQASKNGLLNVAINSLQDPEQQALISANRQFSDLYRFSLSGQQSSDAERLSMMLSITETAGDSDAVIAQKSRMRDLMIQVTAQRAAGLITEQNAASQMLNASLALGNPEITAAYANSLSQVVDAAGGTQVSSVPGVNTLNDVEDLVDGALR